MESETILQEVNDLRHRLKNEIIPNVVDGQNIIPYTVAWTEKG